MTRQQVIEIIAKENAISLKDRIETLQKIDEGENHEDVLREFRAMVFEEIESHL